MKKKVLYSEIFWRRAHSLTDIDIQSVTPLWPPPAQGVVVNGGVYEGATVPVTSIALVTSRTIKVTSVDSLILSSFTNVQCRQIDVDSILEQSRSSAQEATTQLENLANEYSNSGHIPEVDWARMRVFEFQELLSRRISLARDLEGLSCVLCEDFEQHVRSSTLSDFSGLTCVIVPNLTRGACVARRHCKSQIGNLGSES